MGTFAQIALGTFLLAFCAVVHVGFVAFSVPYFERLSSLLPVGRLQRLRIVAFLSLTIVVLVLAHTIQIWSWSVVFLMIADLSDLPSSFYFATVTYTTLGYGDIVLGPDARIVATFCAITGLLTFGISTAFFIGVLNKILPELFTDRGDKGRTDGP